MPPVITLNNSTGSNVTASGAPASLTAISGSAAAHTGGAASTTITLTNTPDLSGVPTDGTAVIYLATASGRKFSVITAVDNGADTVTVEDTFTIDSGSAVNYAIGGKRKDFEDTNEDTKAFGSDNKAGWELEIEETGTDYVVTTTALTMTIGGSEAVGWIRVGSHSATKPVITSNTDNINIFSINGNIGRIMFFGLEITHGSSGTNKGHGIAVTGGSPSPINIYDCHIHDCEIGVSGNGSGWTVINTIIEDCVSHGWNATPASSFNNSIFRRNGGNGILFNAGGGGISIRNCLIVDNTSVGAASGTSAHSRQFVITNSTIANNGGSGLTTASEAGGSWQVLANIFYGNGGFGLDNVTDRPEDILFNMDNAYGGNTSGDHDAWADGKNKITLTADPFADAVSGDYRLNNVAGGGALLASAGFNGMDIGAMPQEQVSGGASVIIRRGGLAARL